MNKPRKFSELVGDADMAALEQVLQRSRQLRRLSALIKEKLGPGLEAHAQVGNVRGNTLILIAASTTWATRLRYSIPDLLRRFQEHDRLSKITDIRIRIVPENRTPKAQQPRRANMSADASHCIQQCADSVTDEKLSSALKRLASRRRQ